METFCIGDIHGRIDALNEVLDESKFDDKSDCLILVGDLVDGGKNSRDVVDRIIRIKHRILVLGNHDLWFMNWVSTGQELPIWYHQGGIWTILSYGGNHKMVPDSHKKFFYSGLPFYRDKKNRLFVHGGFIPNHPIRPTVRTAVNSLETLIWDRTLIEYARYNKVASYYEIYVGHTTTQHYGKNEPVRFNNLWMMDCGAGWNGRLAMINVDSKEYWLSQYQIPHR